LGLFAIACAACAEAPPRAVSAEPPRPALVENAANARDATDAAPRVDHGDALANADAGAAAVVEDSAAVVEAGAPAAPPLCPRVLVLTRKISTLKEATFMLRREEKTALATDDFAIAAAAAAHAKPGARVPAAEEALSRAFDRWVGDSIPRYGATAAANGRLDFTARGERRGYATCHGVVETFDLRGSITLDASDEIAAMTVTGTAVVTEDMCSASGNGRVKMGTHRATYEGHLERRCGPAGVIFDTE
jgi:hypothetical protein